MLTLITKMTKVSKIMQIGKDNADDKAKNEDNKNLSPVNATMVSIEA